MVVGAFSHEKDKKKESDVSLKVKLWICPWVELAHVKLAQEG